jgi:hypothetical protein
MTTNNLKLNGDSDLFNRMYMLSQDIMFKDILNTANNMDVDFTDALSIGQLKSKQWIVQALININNQLHVDDGTDDLPVEYGRGAGLLLGNIFIVGGWYGLLASMLSHRAVRKSYQGDDNIKTGYGLTIADRGGVARQWPRRLKIYNIRSFDINPECEKIADSVNGNWVKMNWQFKAITEDMHNINYEGHTWSAWSSSNNRMSHPVTEEPDTIINTSCEHIENFSDWYAKMPKGKLLVLQNNNYSELEEHVNCVNSVEEFAEQTPMKDVFFAGELDVGKYKRYMRIGIR